MTKVLVIGGPHHGEDVDKVGKVWTPMVPAQARPGMPVIALPTNYILRDLDATFEEGKRRKYVYVHESVTNPQEFMGLLTNYLLGEWLRKDGEVVEETEDETEADTHKVVFGGPGAGATAVDGQPLRAASGLYIPG